MNSILKVMSNVKKFNDYIFDIDKGKTPIMLTGLTDVGKVQFACATKLHIEKPIFIITYNELQAKKLMKDIEFFGEDVKFFPKREITSFDYIAESKEILFDRIATLNDLVKGKNEIVITTVEAAMQKMIPKEVLYKNILTLKTGNSINIEKLKEILVSLGYERCDMIEGKGQFSVRGGIVDIAYSEKMGIRVELWGDEIDSIRRFSISTQRTVSMIEEIEITPAFEFLLERSVDEVCKLIEESDYNEELKERIEEDIEQIKSGEYLPKIDKYFDMFYSDSFTLIDYIDKNSIVFLDEIEKIRSRVDDINKDNENLVNDLIEKGKIVPKTLTSEEDYIKLFDELKEKEVVYLEKQDLGFVDQESIHAKRNGYSFSYREIKYFRSSMDLLFKELQDEIKRRKEIVILGGSQEACNQLISVLSEKEIPTNYIEILDDDLPQGVVNITKGSLSDGFEFYDGNLIVISLDDMFEVKKKSKSRTPKVFSDGEKIVFADLKEGDYIVHRNHGIGQFVGINTIRADGITKDYIKLKYKGDDILYVPTDSLDNIRKYIGPEKVGPALNKLGSSEWKKTKDKVKNNLRQVAEELIELYARRQKMEGFAYSQDTVWQKEFEDSFKYQETDDQLRCIKEIKKDMERPRPMDRLLCGDVGYGKTEVAIRAAFKAVMDQKQVAYLAPTTVLAQQQYDEFVSRMKDYPIRIGLLNRFRTRKEQKETLKKLEDGQLDVLIGTHRILSQDVEFKNLGFLVIDEEHRFGVKAKEKIKEYKNSIDVLTMTATPIPRTLHMSIVGMRDMSVIYEPPNNRKPVQTYVLEYDKEVIREAITRELERSGQVFYLFNNVEGIERKAHKISELVPEAKVVFAHGKMTGTELENIMEDFVAGNSNVLVCTTILESGIDIPNANTIIVENSDRLGLAQLYQIRGRVGRSDRQAYAYITYRRDKNISEVADKRLKAIKEFTEFGSGFKIAMRDLEIRGAGSLMGEIQHGHMDQVGYDMYCELLNQVVKEIKGEKIEEEKDVQIDLDLTSYIPEEYISSANQKIDVYQKIALCKTEDDIQNITDEIIDRYGQMPYEVENLLEITRIKNLAKQKEILKVMQKRENLVFYFDKDKFNLDVVDKLMKLYRNRIKFSPSSEPYITFKMLELKEIVKECKDFLNKL